MVRPGVLLAIVVLAMTLPGAQALGGDIVTVVLVPRGDGDQGAGLSPFPEIGGAQVQNSARGDDVFLLGNATGPYHAVVLVLRNESLSVEGYPSPNLSATSVGLAVYGNEVALARDVGVRYEDFVLVGTPSVVFVTTDAEPPATLVGSLDYLRGVRIVDQEVWHGYSSAANFVLLWGPKGALDLLASDIVDGLLRNAALDAARLANFHIDADSAALRMRLQAVNGSEEDVRGVTTEAPVRAQEVNAQLQRFALPRVEDAPSHLVPPEFLSLFAEQRADLQARYTPLLEGDLAAFEDAQSLAGRARLEALQRDQVDIAQEQTNIAQKQVRTANVGLWVAGLSAAVAAVTAFQAGRELRVTREQLTLAREQLRLATEAFEQARSRIPPDRDTSSYR